MYHLIIRVRQNKVVDKITFLWFSEKFRITILSVIDFELYSQSNELYITFS